MTSLISMASFLECRMEASDYPPSTVTGTDNSLQGRTRFVKIGPLGCKPAQCCVSICYYSCEWLVNLMPQHAVDGVNTFLQLLAAGNVHDCREHHCAVFRLDRVEADLDGKLAAIPP